MNVFAWILQILMAALFLPHGVAMIAPPESITRRLEERGRALTLPRGVVVLTGVAEVLAAVGLILPGLTGIAPVLVPLAAIGLALIMCGATIYHVRRHEGWAGTVTIGLICVVIAVIRLTVAPL